MASISATGSKGNHTFKLTVTPITTYPTTAGKAYVNISFDLSDGGNWYWNHSATFVSYAVTVGGVNYSGNCPNYTSGSSMNIFSKTDVLVSVSSGNIAMSFSITDGINAYYTPGDCSATGTMTTSYYFTAVGKPTKPSIVQNSDGSITISGTAGSNGTNNTVSDVHIYYRWNSSTSSGTYYDAGINTTYNSTTRAYSYTIPASTVLSKKPSSIYAVAYTIGARANSSASEEGSKTELWYYTGVGAPTNVSVTYLATSNKFRVTGNAGTSGTNNAVTGILWCWELEGMSDNGAYPYTWHGRYDTTTEDHNRGTISCSAGASFSFDIPVANKNTTHYTFVIYTQGTYNNNYGGDYAGIHVIRNAYTGNTVTGLSTHTVHNIVYGYTAAIEDFTCYRVNIENTNGYDYYVTAGTSTVGINICGIGYDVKYFADEARSDLITRGSWSDFCSAGEFIGGTLYYPDVSVSKVYLTIEMYTLYDNTGTPSAIGPMTTYDMEMIRYTPCISPTITLPNPETSHMKFVPFTGGDSAELVLGYTDGVDGDNNPITTTRIELVNYTTDELLVTTGAPTLPLTEIVSLVDRGTPILVRVVAYSSEWGEMWFPTESPILDNGWYANQVVLYLYETGYVFQRVGDTQQPSFVYTKVNGSWKIATPDVLVKQGGTWKGTVNEYVFTNIYDK